MTNNNLEEKIYYLKQELLKNNYSVLSNLYSIFKNEVEPQTIETHSIAIAFLHFGTLHKDLSCLQIQQNLILEDIYQNQQFYINEKLRIEKNLIDLEKQHKELKFLDEKDCLKNILLYFNKFKFYEKYLNDAISNHYIWINFITFMKSLQFSNNDSHQYSKGFFFLKQNYKNLGLKIINPTKFSTNNINLKIYDNNDELIFTFNKFLIQPFYNDIIPLLDDVSIDYKVSKVIISIRNTEKLCHLPRVDFTYFI